VPDRPAKDRGRTRAEGAGLRELEAGVAHPLLDGERVGPLLADAGALRAVVERGLALAPATEPGQRGERPGGIGEIVRRQDDRRDDAIRGAGRDVATEAGIVLAPGHVDAAAKLGRVGAGPGVDDRMVALLGQLLVVPTGTFATAV